MTKRFFQYMGITLLILTVTSQAGQATGTMMAQTTEPSVGHKTDRPNFGHVYKFNSGSGAGLKQTPLPGFRIAIDSRNHIWDIDNARYSAGEDIDHFRSIYRVDRSGNEVVVESNTPVTIDGRPHYVITDDDIGYKLRLEYVRRSSSSSFTPLPAESDVQKVVTEEVSPPLVPATPVLFVNGVERPDFKMYHNEVGYLKYRIVNRDGQPMGNKKISVTDSNQTGTGEGTSIKLEPSSFNENGEVERKIITSGTDSSTDRIQITFSSQYNGVDLLANDVTIFVSPPP
ncbi:hypothetical protein ZL58_23755 [Salmonella enterica subsp. enterica serovar Typhimurium]|nr:hypothetical protein [Salmonella enterica subsp. enterica serovar Typhimurium]